MNQEIYFFKSDQFSRRHRRNQERLPMFEPLDRLRFAAETTSRNHRIRHLAAYFCLAAGAALMTGGIFGADIFTIAIATGVFVVSYIGAATLRNWNRPRCPACKSPLPNAELVLACRHCPTCDEEIFAPQTEAPFYPESLIALPPASPLCLWPFLLPFGAFFGGMLLGGLAGEIFSALQLLGQGCLSFGGGIFAAGLGLRFMDFLNPEPHCPVCGKMLQSALVNATGNCNRCGVKLLTTLPPLPEATLPARSHLFLYRRLNRKSEITIFVWLTLIGIGVMIFRTRAHPWLPLLGMYLFGFVIPMIVRCVRNARFRRQHHLTGRCPNCGKAPSAVFFPFPRCSFCGRMRLR